MMPRAQKRAANIRAMSSWAARIATTFSKGDARLPWLEGGGSGFGAAGAEDTDGDEGAGARVSLPGGGIGCVSGFAGGLAAVSELMAISVTCMSFVRVLVIGDDSPYPSADAHTLTSCPTARSENQSAFSPLAFMRMCSVVLLRTWTIAPRTGDVRRFASTTRRGIGYVIHEICVRTVGWTRYISTNTAAAPAAVTPLIWIFRLN